MISTKDEQISDSASIVIAKASAASTSGMAPPKPGIPCRYKHRVFLSASSRSQRPLRLSCPSIATRLCPYWVVMAKSPDKSKTPKTPGRTSRAKAGRPDVQPIGPALAELLNPAINRGESGIGSSTGLQPPPDNSWDRRAGGEAAAHRARASTRGSGEDVAKRDAEGVEKQGFGEAPQREFAPANYG